MLLPLFSKVSILAALVCVVFTTVGFGSRGNQDAAGISVNGRALSGPGSTALRRGIRFFLPLEAIARALGDKVAVNRAARTIAVYRQTGIEADFNADTNQIRESGATVLIVQSGAEIAFAAEASERLLPVEIIAALFDATIRFDREANVFNITRGAFSAGATVPAPKKHSLIEIYQANYQFDLSCAAASFNQSLSVEATGRIVDGRFALASDFDGSVTGTQDGQSHFNFRRGAFIFERENFQKFSAGDFGVNSDVRFMPGAIRGLSATFGVVRGVRLTSFAGRSRSGMTAVSPEMIETCCLNQSEQTNSPSSAFISASRRFSFDTSVLGATLTKAFSLPGFRPTAVSVGFLRYGSRSRRGEIIAGNFSSNNPNFSFSGDFGAGRFSRSGGVSRRRGGSVMASAFDLSATWRPISNFSLHARLAQVGSQFSGVQSYLIEPVKLASGGINWQAARWLNVSLSGTSAASPLTRQRTSFATLAVNLHPGKNLPAVYFSHTASDGSLLKKSSFTLFNFNYDFLGLRLFGGAARSSRATGSTALNAQLGARFAFNDKNAVEVWLSGGSHRSWNGFADYQASNLFNQRMTLGVGVGYSFDKNSGMARSAARLTTGLRLPNNTFLQINYHRTAAQNVFFFSVRGDLFRRKRAAAASEAAVGEMLAYGSYSGRVYQDVNTNGIYDAGVDKPQPKAVVRVDGSRVAETADDGSYRIDNVRVGNHRINLDLLSVRADLTILDKAEQNVELPRGAGSASVDFRLIRTGRIKGIVWIDNNENGLPDASEMPLPDVRVVVPGASDTLSDESGAFAIGDLPPGNYVILIDEKTLPAKMQSANRAPLAVEVLAGAETGNVKMPVIFIPAQVRRF